MRRLLTVAAITTAMVIPATVAIVGPAESAYAASTVTCGGLTGSISSTVTISLCKPSGGKGYKTASAPATSLATGGKLTWSKSGATTTIGHSSVTQVTPNMCGTSTEYSFTGKVTAASTKGTGIPVVGDRVAAKACLSGAGTITLLPGTKLKL